MQSTIRKHLSLAKVNSTMSIIINNWRMDPSLNALIHCETGETRRLGEYHF
ncbi:transcriptional regulator, partial [Escherichia coli]|nr:transcriptional regulator [Escherichia coli]